MLSRCAEKKHFIRSHCFASANFAPVSWPLSLKGLIRKENSFLFNRLDEKPVAEKSQVFSQKGPYVRSTNNKK